jgi:hypothetical protein
MPTINGTAGDDTLNGTSSDDAINGLAGNDTLSGGNGNDTLAGGTGNDVLDGGAGRDLVSYAAASAGVVVSLSSSSSQNTGEGNDTLVSIEDLWGSNFNDSLFGNADSNWIAGFDGDDQIAGNSGIDVLEGGLGNDTYLITTYGGATPGDHEAAEINDGGGYDTVKIFGSPGSTTTFYAGDVGIDRIQFESGRVDGTNIDARAVGNPLLIVGNEGTNILWGTAFGDTLDGRGLDDQLTGGAGADILIGGEGIDRFVDTAAGLNGDTITDFSLNEKIIITDATLAGFTFSVTGSTLTYTGGSLALSAPINGRLIASAAAGGGVELTIWSSLIPALPAPPGPPNTDPLYGYDPNSYTVAAGTYLFMQSHSSTLFTQDIVTLTNAGTIYLGHDPYFYGDLRIAGNYPVITNFINSGTVVVHTENTEFPSGSIALADVTTVNNSGDIFVTSANNHAVFLQTWKSGASVVNSGSIYVYAPTNQGTGINMVNGGTVTNQTGGEIIVDAANAHAVSGFDLNVTNAGLIQSSGWAVSMGVGQVNNSGVITGGTASVSMSGTLTNSGTLNGDVVSAGSLLTFNNQTGGVLNGDFIGGDSFDPLNPQLTDFVNNAGIITGDAFLQRGNDTFINIGSGHIDGVVYMGFGADQYTGSSGIDRVAGDQDNDTLNGAGGDDLLLGGNNDDQLIGGVGNDGLYGESGNDKLITEGGDDAIGGSGDDRVELGDYSFHSVSGGAGIDTLVLKSGAHTLDLSAALATGRISNFEIIEMRANQGLVVRPADVAALGAGTSLRIDALASDTVTLVGAWIHGTDVTVNGAAYEQWTLNGVTVLVSLTATVTAAASGPGGSIGLSAIAAGDAPLIPGEASGLELTPTLYQVGYYHINGNTVLDAGDTWFSLNGDTGVWADTDDTRFTVNGTLAAFNDVAARVIAVDFMNQAQTVNNGTITAQSEGP